MGSDARQLLATVCIGYSAIGALFMSWVGIMIKYQSFYIKGLKDERQCGDSAFKAAILFVVTLSTCVGYLIYDKVRIRREVAYAAVDNSAFDIMLPRGMTDYAVRDIELT